MSRVVVCAALRNNCTGLIICGARHFDALMHMQISSIGGPEWPSADQGFIDQYGVFMTRTEAWNVAFKAGQIVRGTSGPKEMLFSENLY